MSQRSHVKNAASVDQVRAAGFRLKRERERELSDFRAMMQLEEGRRFIWRLLETSGFQKSSFTGNNETFFNEGMRNIGLIVWADLNESSSDLYVQMLQEAKERAMKEEALAAEATRRQQKGTQDDND